ncbi:uncharacterized protein LOC125496641 [Beta vulgaris subsp. vulgaris]|uniref:uncharacterized protein LOC125496641 n=1 Tax=Beta vulgaris subsp. vulgaris TaxID=3555 RepID=UPI002546B17B|nr:uncharacterized protein LOC125496641 [Beta vulgaris subsp. vulgaris]
MHASALRAALGEPSLSKKLSNVSTETNEFLKEEYIIDMCDLVESRKPGLYVCYGTIEDIDVELGWYYEACKICFSGINKKQDGGMRCKKENHIVRYPIPRYRVKIIVTDGTGDATFVLFDKEVRKFVDKSASELLKLHKKDDESFPEEFLVFLGKKLLFKVDLQYYNNYNQSPTFTVVNTTDDQDVIGKWMGMYIRMEDDRTVKKQIEAESVKEIDGAQATSTRDNESTPTSKTPLKRGLEDPNLLDLSCEDSKVDAQCKEAAEIVRRKRKCLLEDKPDRYMYSETSNKENEPHIVPSVSISDRFGTNTFNLENYTYTTPDHLRTDVTPLINNPIERTIVEDKHSTTKQNRHKRRVLLTKKRLEKDTTRDVQLPYMSTITTNRIPNLCNNDTPNMNHEAVAVQRRELLELQQRSSALRCNKQLIQSKRVLNEVTRRFELGNSSGSLEEGNSTIAFEVDQQNPIESDGNHGECSSYAGDYWDIGDPIWECEYCGAMMWFEERTKKHINTTKPKFSQCCMQGKVQLPLLRPPPKLLSDLLEGKHPRSKHFFENIRPYNMMHSFTSMGGKVIHPSTQGRGPYNFKIGGQNHHLIGSLLPNEGSRPKFSQLYIYDTEHEINNRKNAVSSKNPKKFEDPLIAELQNMIDEHNPLAKIFRMARDRFKNDACENVKLKLIGRRESDGRTYNLPTTNEVAALIVGDIDSADKRDIIVETKGGKLKQISELHPSYLALQYPLLFPYGEDGYRVDVSHRDGDLSNPNSNKRDKLTMREFFAYRIHDRRGEAETILLSRRLLQQLSVDGYTMMEAQRLSFVRHNQKSFRADNVKNLRGAADRGDTEGASTGSRVVIPASFTGGHSYMRENYQDAMAICRWYGYPDLFITFTCNPKWPEITRFVSKKGLRPEDRPDIIVRVFKMKLDQLVKDLKDRNIFGRVRAVVYTIEFQKRGLPHAHILLFLHRDDKFPDAEAVDKIICAELPNKDENPDLYEIVATHMMHGPCGASNLDSPCMVDKMCTKHFPKRFNERTTVDEDGYPVYRRRDNGATVEKNGVMLDNRFVVPYNSQLLWYDRVTATAYHNRQNPEDPEKIDEIKMYYDCRYISPCEAMWRIYGFPIHFRIPAVERLSFHLPDEQTVLFTDDADVEEVLERPHIEKTKFLSWMECNKEHAEARELSYVEFPTKFVWQARTREWTSRKKGFAIGRIYHVTPGAGEKFYLRTLLNYVKGATCYEDIRVVDGVLHPTFKEACYARGLLDDDKEYVDAIMEASFRESGHYLRNLFCMMLLSCSLSKPENIWQKTWHLLSEDILHRQRTILRDQALHLSDEQLQNYALAEIEAKLQSNEENKMKSFSNFSKD